MRGVFVPLAVLCFASLAFAQPATQPAGGPPDVSTMSAEGLRVLVTNQHRVLQKAQTEARDAGFRLAAVLRQLYEREKQIEQMQAELQRLRAIIDSDPVARERLDTADRIAEAIKSGKMAAGMMVEQANQALGLTGRKIGDNEDGETWQWTREGTQPAVTDTGRVWQKSVTTGRWTAEVRDGKIVRFDHTGAE